MSEFEVLSCILFIGLRRTNTTRLAYGLIERYGSFANIISIPVADLLAVKGMTMPCVLALKTIRLSSLFLLRHNVALHPIIDSRENLEEYLRALLGKEKVEHSRVIFLDSKHRLLGEKLLSKGTVNHVAIYPREAIKEALALDATALLLVHNHPSGNPMPSKEDINMTRHFQKLCSDLGLILHDHIIVTNTSCFSLIKDGSPLFPNFRDFTDSIPKHSGTTEDGNTRRIGLK